MIKPRSEPPAALANPQAPGPSPLNPWCWASPWLRSRLEVLVRMLHLAQVTL